MATIGYKNGLSGRVNAGGTGRPVFPFPPALKMRRQDAPGTRELLYQFIRNEFIIRGLKNNIDICNTNSYNNASWHNTIPDNTMKIKTRVFELANGKYQNVSILAKAMGLSVSQVYRVREGKRGINEKFIIGAKRAFPENRLDELFYFQPPSAFRKDHESASGE